MSFKFTSALRLRSPVEFAAVQQEGRRVGTRLFVLLGKPNSLTHDRLGIIASRRFGGAVLRNRAKRRIREAFRRQEPDSAVTQGQRPLDLVVIPKRELLTAPREVVEADVRSAIRKLRVR